MKKFIFLFFVCLSSNILSQDFFDLPLAREIWSEPVKVENFSLPYRYESEASFSQSMDTIYYFKSTSIFSSLNKNGTWTSPKELNNYINNGSPVRCPVVSKDGKRLYFSSWRGGYGAWDLFCSDWDSTTNDWGVPNNLGPTINSELGEYYAYELNKDTLYCINDRWAGMGVCIYVKNNLSNKWEIVDSSNYCAGNIKGLSISRDGKKAYFSRYVNQTIDSLQSELYVTYWDSKKNRWGNSFRLNINSVAYRVRITNEYSIWKGGWDEFPWISPDGKTLYFASNRDAARQDSNDLTPDIYVSHLIIDENGDSVTMVKNYDKIKNSDNELKLLSNYPNPFNPETNILFELPQNDKISLIIYDILGREKEILIESKYYRKGLHNLKWEINQNSNYCSGVYFLRLFTNNSSITNKVIYIK